MKLLSLKPVRPLQINSMLPWEGLDIPAADLLFVTFQAEGIIYLALLKMNYKESYTHEITEIPDNPVINTDIIKTHSLLPSATSRIPEAVVINLSDYHIKLLEKKYEINGEKAYYLSENFLVCRTSIPPKEVKYSYSCY